MAAPIRLALQEALEGRYWLDRELGRGGMGIVYLAWEAGLQRQVALKILPPALATERRRARFLSEARLAASLQHDHIVPIYAVGEAGPFVYYTMAYIQGWTLLDRILLEGQLPAGEATRILHDVARAVGYAHSHGIIHRDLKPNNILIAENGRVYVADFGLARALSETPGPGGGATFGTYHYVSPEQAAGLPADHRSDVYSLGALGFAMAAGRAPFVGTPDEIVAQHISRRAPALGVLNQHLDVTLSRAVRRCLAKDPADRFQTAGALARALSLAPELREEPRPDLKVFLDELRSQTRTASLGVLLGFGAISVFQRAVQAGAWIMSAASAAVVGLLLASPILGALPAVRKLLEKGYARSDIIHAFHMDLERQRRALAARSGRGTDATAKATGLRRVVGGALVLTLLAGAAALSGLDLPPDPVMWSLVIGLSTTLIGGVALLWYERWRNQLWGDRWLSFWASRLGRWTVKLAGFGLKRIPFEPELPESDEPEAVPPASRPAQPVALLASDVDDLGSVVDRGATLAGRGREHLEASAARSADDRTATKSHHPEREHTLERQLAVLEEVLARLRSADPAGDGSRSLADDVELARQASYVVEALLEVEEEQ